MVTLPIRRSGWRHMTIKGRVLGYNYKHKVLWYASLFHAYNFIIMLIWQILNASHIGWSLSFDFIVTHSSFLLPTPQVLETPLEFAILVTIPITILV